FNPAGAVKCRVGSRLRRRGGRAGRRWRRGGAADADGRLAQEARDDLVAVVLLDQHELAALRVGALDGEDHVVGCWLFVDSYSGRTPPAATNNDLLTTNHDHWIRSPFTHSASRAISASDSPLLRRISVRAILPLVMSSAITSIRPLLPTPQRTWIGDRFGRLGGSPSIQHSPMLMQASACWASPCSTLTRTRGWFSTTVR